MDEIGKIMEVLRAVAIAVANGNRKICGTVVGIMPGDDVLTRRLAAPRVIEMCEPDRRVVGTGAGRRKSHMVERPGRQFRQLGRKLGSRCVAHVHEGIGVGQQQRLLRHGFRHFLAAIAHVHAPHAAQPVEVALAVDIGDVRAFALHNEQGAFLLETVKMRPGMQEMIVILLP